MNTVRAFIAAEIEPEVRNRIAELLNRLQACPMKVRWVPPENLHWTLQFLGEVELTQTAEVCQHITAVAAGSRPFDIQAQGIGAFPRLERPRTVWLGANDGAEAMVTLAERLQDRLAQLGFAGESRRFTPHLTLGRVREAHRAAHLADWLEPHLAFDAGTMHIDQMVLFSSRLESGGPVYEPLGRAALDGTGV